MISTRLASSKHGLIFTNPACAQYMNVLHVAHRYQPALGGSERLIQHISENLVARDDDKVEESIAGPIRRHSLEGPASAAPPS